MGERGAVALCEALRGHSAIEYIDFEGECGFLLQMAFCVLIAARFQIVSFENVVLWHWPSCCKGNAH